jgi:hypothetical protein
MEENKNILYKIKGESWYDIYCPQITQEIKLNIEEGSIVEATVVMPVTPEWVIDCKKQYVTINEEYLLRDIVTIKSKEYDDGKYRCVLTDKDIILSHEIMEYAYKVVLECKAKEFITLKIYMDDEKLKEYSKKYELIKL